MCINSSLDFVLTCFVLDRSQGVAARGAVETFTSLTFPPVSQDGYGLAVPSVVLLLKCGMRCNLSRAQCVPHQRT